MFTYKKILGFSLIELLVVMALIAGLTTLAVPAYKTSLIKSRVLNLLSSVEPIKMQLTEQLAMGIAPNNNINIDLHNKYIENISIVNNDLATKPVYIAVTANKHNLGINDEANFLLKLVAHVNSDSINWLCELPLNYKNYLPTNCTD